MLDRDTIEAIAENHAANQVRVRLRRFWPVKLLTLFTVARVVNLLSM